MKKLLFLLFAFSISFVQSQNVNITCRFVSPVADSCSIRIDKYHIKEFEPFYKTIIKDNQCNFKFNIEKPTMTEFIYNKQSVNIWVEPNDSLTLTITNDSLSKAITMAGTGAIHNEFLKTFFSTFKNDFDRSEEHTSEL